MANMALITGSGTSKEKKDRAMIDSVKLNGDFFIIHVNHFQRGSCDNSLLSTNIFYLQVDKRDRVVYNL